MNDPQVMTTLDKIVASSLNVTDMSLPGLNGWRVGNNPAFQAKLKAREERKYQQCLDEMMAWLDE